MKKAYSLLLLISTFMFFSVSCSNFTASSKYFSLIDKYFYASVFFNKQIHEQISEDKLKLNLIKYYSDICTNPLFDNLITWIDSTSIYGSEYGLYYEELSSYKLSTDKKIEYTSDGVVVKLQAEKTEPFTFTEKGLKISSIVKDYKIENYSQQQVDDIIKSEKFADLIELHIKSKVEMIFLIINTKGGCRISKFEETVLKSILSIDLPKSSTID